MGLNKGTTNNPNGRPKGAQNKLTIEIRDKIHGILDHHFTEKKINEDLNSLEPKDRLQLLVKLLDFTTPKMKQTDITTVVQKDLFPVMTPDERRERIKVLKAKLLEDDE